MEKTIIEIESSELNELFLFINKRQKDKFINNEYIHFSCDLRTEILNYLYKLNEDLPINHYSILADYYIKFITDNHYSIIEDIENYQMKLYRINNKLLDFIELYYDVQLGYYNNELTDMIKQRSKKMIVSHFNLDNINKI